MEDCYENMNILSIEQAKKVALSTPKDQKVVIVTGVTGQDGSFMADYLLKHTDHILFGGARRLSVYNHANIEHLDGNPRFHLINFDLTDAHSISQIISQLNPDYFINFAAQSFVKSSWDFPAQTWETNTTGVLNILESIRLHAPYCRFYNAGSSEEFGNIGYSPQDELHPLRPRSPYGASKAAGRQLVKVYRESYNLYAVQGWLFNHEGTRRGEEFVSRKVTKKVCEIAAAIKTDNSFTPLELGNLDASRDWSDAEDMVDAVWRMLNQEKFNNSFHFNNGTPSIDLLSKIIKEYVVASGETHSVREFVEEAFKCVGIKGLWCEKGEKEYLWYTSGPKPLASPDCKLVIINSGFYRPAEVDVLHGNSSLIRNDLKWTPVVSFKELVKKMVLNDTHL